MLNRLGRTLRFRLSIAFDLAGGKGRYSCSGAVEVEIEGVSFCSSQGLLEVRDQLEKRLQR